MSKKLLILFYVVFYTMTLWGQSHQANVLPQIIIDTENNISPQRKVEAHMTAGDYDGPIGIKLRGNSSLSFNQKKYTIELRDAEGHDVEAPLLDMPAHSDWVLLAPYNDVSAVRDPLAFQLWRDMGHWAPRTRMAEVVLNGEYQGIYIVAEAIKRGKQRVDIDKLKDTDIKGRDVTGGYLLRIDTYKDDDATFKSKVPGIGEGIMSSQITWSCIYPKKKNIQPEQLDYIHHFIDTVELTIQSEQFDDPQKGYAHYIDVPSFVDYFIHSELSLNADGYKRSAYFYKEKLHADGTGGKLVAGPVWDYNLAYGNCNFCNADNIEAWCFEGGNTQPTPALWQRLLQDPAFRKAVKRRYEELRKGVLSDKKLNDYIDRHVQFLKPHIQQHFKKYPELFVDKEQKNNQQQQRFPFMGGFPGMGGLQRDSVQGQASGHFPQGFPFMGGFPGMRGFQRDSVQGVPDGQFPQGFPFMGGFPGMRGLQRDSVQGAPGGQSPQGFPFMGGFPGMGGDAISWFAAYRVSSYEEEITILKQWLKDRLAFLDRNIARFDKDWEPHIQKPVETKAIQFPGMPQFNRFPPFQQ